MCGLGLNELDHSRYVFGRLDKRDKGAVLLRIFGETNERRGIFGVSWDIKISRKVGAAEASLEVGWLNGLGHDGELR